MQACAALIGGRPASDATGSSIVPPGRMVGRAARMWQVGYVDDDAAVEELDETVSVLGKRRRSARPAAGLLGTADPAHAGFASRLTCWIRL